MSPKLLFGTATFGMDGTPQQTAADVFEVLKTLKKHNLTHLDTAARYPPTQPTVAESLLGEALKTVGHEGWTIDTKVLTVGLLNAPGAGKGDLCKENMRASVDASLKRLGVRKVSVLYAHVMDKATSLEEQVEAFNEQGALGHCAEWGVCNHTVEQLKGLLEACERKGVKKPSVYQGDYNVLTRGLEKDMLPLLRQHGMRFVGFRPIAGGFLTGGLASGNVAGTRFDPNINSLATAAGNVFSAADLHAAFHKFNDTVAKRGLSSIEVALRWLVWHSPLSENDGVILGASKMSQLEQNLASIEKGQLDEEMLQACEELWTGLKESRGGVY